MRTITWDTSFGPCEFRVGELEQRFIDWAVKQGYEEMDAVYTMACDGISDTLLYLDDAWEAFQAGAGVESAW